MGLNKLMFVFAQDQNGTGRVPYDVFGGASEKGAFESSAAVGGNNDQINAQFPGGIDDDASWMTGLDHGFYRASFTNRAGQIAKLFFARSLRFLDQFGIIKRRVFAAGRMVIDVNDVQHS